MEKLDKVQIYTDGGCSGNPGPGGWGAIILWNSREKELSGYMEETTNNQMEMLAVIEALKTLKRKCDVTVVTDSKYVQQGMLEWMPKWKAAGWKKKGGEIKNLSLWKQLDAEAARHQIAWKWIKGHSGHPLNERADQLAVAAYQNNM